MVESHALPYSANRSYSCASSAQVGVGGVGRRGRELQEVFLRGCYSREEGGREGDPSPHFYLSAAVNGEKLLSSFASFSSLSLKKNRDLLTPYFLFHQRKVNVKLFEKGILYINLTKIRKMSLWSLLFQNGPSPPPPLSESVIILILQRFWSSWDVQGSGGQPIQLRIDFSISTSIFSRVGKRERKKFL